MQQNNAIKRHIGLDMLKCICAFLIICIHAPFPGEFGKYITSLSRISVPIFLMITGFYYKKVVNTNKENEQIKKIIKLILFSNAIYIVFDIIKYSLSGKLLDFVLNLFSLKTIFKLIILNESPFAWHLWYLNSLLYVLIIYKLFCKKEKIKKFLLIISPILLIIDLCLGKYSLLLFNNEISYFYLRNFIFVGIPYFTIGYFLNNYLNKNKKYSFKFNTLLVFIFIFTNIIEKYLLTKYSVNAVRDSYISTTFLSILIFIHFYNTSKNYKLLSNIGKKHSTYIYIFHPIIIAIMMQITKRISLYNAYIYTQPVIVFIITLLVSYIYIILIKKCLKKYI